MLVKFCLKADLAQEAEAKLDSDVEVEKAVEEAPFWYTFVSAERFASLHKSNSTHANQTFFFLTYKLFTLPFLTVHERTYCEVKLLSNLFLLSSSIVKFRLHSVFQTFLAKYCDN